MTATCFNRDPYAMVYIMSCPWLSPSKCVKMEGKNDVNKCVYMRIYEDIYMYEKQNDDSLSPTLTHAVDSLICFKQVYV